MAEPEIGAGISWKLKDGTMIWVKRADWAEVVEDIRIIKGETYLKSLEAELRSGASTSPVATPVQGNPAPAPTPSEEPLTPEAVAQALGGGEVSAETFQVCPACGALKDKWVPPGTSKRTGKAYKGFYGCPTRGCPGK
jgi:hypothetical protein